MFQATDRAAAPAASRLAPHRTRVPGTARGYIQNKRGAKKRLVSAHRVTYQVYYYQVLCINHYRFWSNTGPSRTVNNGRVPARYYTRVTYL